MGRLRNVACAGTVVAAVGCTAPTPAGGGVPIPPPPQTYDVKVSSNNGPERRITVHTPDTGPQTFTDVKGYWSQRYYDLSFGDTVTMLVTDTSQSDLFRHVHCRIDIIRPAKVMPAVEGTNDGAVSCIRSVGRPF